MSYRPGGAFAGTPDEERGGLIKEAITPTVKNAQKVTPEERYGDDDAGNDVPDRPKILRQRTTEQRRGKLKYHREISSDGVELFASPPSLCCLFRLLLDAEPPDLCCGASI